MAKYPDGQSLPDSIERIYRLAAEGDCDGVMAGLKQEFPHLRDIHHEKRLVASIARGREKEILHVQN